MAWMSQIPRNLTPSAVLESKALVGDKKSPWASKRLAIVNFLLCSPESEVQEIVNATGISKKVICGVIECLREQRPAEIAQYGRPPELDAKDLGELRSELDAKKLRSIDQATTWIANKKGLRLSAPCVRKYCR
jgi:hypothetical protein